MQIEELKKQHEIISSDFEDSLKKIEKFENYLKFSEEENEILKSDKEELIIERNNLNRNNKE